MIDVASVLAALRDGATFGIQFSPRAALVTAALAAALWGYPKVKRERRWYAVLVLGVGWLVGDGLRILARTRDYYDSAATYAASGLPTWPGWTMLATWALVTLALGYVIPAMAGGAVGRRVTHGTGWLAAAAIASALVLGLSSAISALG